ncbi:MAG: LD-carboxypeptidase [Ferruginibacter sp.]
MNRKYFLSSFVPLGATLVAMGEGKNMDEPDGNLKIPPYLKKGDVIGITCPAGFITQKDIEPAIIKMNQWGFEIKIGTTIGKQDFTFGGTDTERLLDFQDMLDDNNVKAIMCARGGYGAVRIIDQIDFKKFVHHPKWIIGFSDVTVIHSHVNKNFGIATTILKCVIVFQKTGAKPNPSKLNLLTLYNNA